MLFGFCLMVLRKSKAIPIEIGRTGPLITASVTLYLGISESQVSWNVLTAFTLILMIIGGTFVIPYTLVQYYPLQYLMGRSTNWVLGLYPVGVVVFLAICYGIWRAGLRNYKSCGS